MKISRILLTSMEMDAEKYISRSPRHHPEGTLLVNVDNAGKCWAVSKEGDDFIKMNIKKPRKIKRNDGHSKTCIF